MSDQPQTVRCLPFYRCHKVVQALKIKAIEINPGVPGTALIVPEDPAFLAFPVSGEYLQKHKPRSGGYYVVYKDGYQSWSPAKEFEYGYTRI